MQGNHKADTESLPRGAFATGSGDSQLVFWVRPQSLVCGSFSRRAAGPSSRVQRGTPTGRGAREPAAHQQWLMPSPYPAPTTPWSSAAVCTSRSSFQNPGLHDYCRSLQWLYGHAYEYSHHKGKVLWDCRCWWGQEQHFRGHFGNLGGTEGIMVTGGRTQQANHPAFRQACTVKNLPTDYSDGEKKPPYNFLIYKPIPTYA